MAGAFRAVVACTTTANVSSSFIFFPCAARRAMLFCRLAGWLGLTLSFCPSVVCRCWCRWCAFPLLEFQPMAPPGGGPGSEGVDQFGDELKPPPGAGNFRVPLRGRAGRHRHTQSSAAVLHRSAYSTGSLGSAIQSEYSRHGKFLPLPPPDSIDEAGESPMGSPHSRGGSRSPKEWQSRGSEILGGFKVGGAAGSAAAAAPRGPSASLRLELQRVAEPEPVDDEELAVRERLLNKFAQEVMRSYPPELVAAVCQPETELSASPTHRRPKPEFVLEDLDTSDWIGPVRTSGLGSLVSSRRRACTQCAGSPPLPSPPLMCSKLHRHLRFPSVLMSVRPDFDASSFFARASSPFFMLDDNMYVGWGRGGCRIDTGAGWHTGERGRFFPSLAPQQDQDLWKSVA